MLEVHLLEDEIAPRARDWDARPGRRGSGPRGSPASSAASAGLTIVRAVAEVDAAGLLDPVGAVAEVDRVEVGGQDLVLRPALLELPGERRLA